MAHRRHAGRGSLHAQEQGHATLDPERHSRDSLQSIAFGSGIINAPSLRTKRERRPLSPRTPAPDELRQRRFGQPGRHDGFQHPAGNVVSTTATTTAVLPSVALPAPGQPQLPQEPDRGLQRGLLSEQRDRRRATRGQPGQ